MYIYKFSFTSEIVFTILTCHLYIIQFEIWIQLFNLNFIYLCLSTITVRYQPFNYPSQSKPLSVFCTVLSNFSSLLNSNVICMRFSFINFLLSKFHRSGFGKLARSTSHGNVRVWYASRTPSVLRLQHCPLQPTVTQQVRLFCAPSSFTDCLISLYMNLIKNQS